MKKTICALLLAALLLALCGCGGGGEQAEAWQPTVTVIDQGGNASFEALGWLNEQEYLYLVINRNRLIDTAGQEEQRSGVWVYQGNIDGEQTLLGSFDFPGYFLFRDYNLSGEIDEESARAALNRALPEVLPQQEAQPQGTLTPDGQMKLTYPDGSVLEETLTGELEDYYDELYQAKLACGDHVLFCWTPISSPPQLALVDTQRACLTTELGGLEDGEFAAFFSPDGKRLLLSSNDIHDNALAIVELTDEAPAQAPQLLTSLTQREVEPGPGIPPLFPAQDMLRYDSNLSYTDAVLDESAWALLIKTETGYALQVADTSGSLPVQLAYYEIDAKECQIYALDLEYVFWLADGKLMGCNYRRGDRFGEYTCVDGE